MNIIVKIEGGMPRAVYTDAPGEITVRMMDEDHRQDGDTSYEAARLLIEKGIVRDTLSDNTSQKPDAAMPMPDPKAVLLLREENRAPSKVGRQEQTALLAYIDGYLTASAALSKEIMKLCSSSEEGQKLDGMRLFALTNGLRGRLSRHYNALVEYLNQPINFSCGPTGPAGEVSVTIRVHHYECEVNDDLLVFHGDQQVIGQVHQTFLAGLRATEQEADGCRCTWLDLAKAYVDSKLGTRSCYSTGEEDCCIDLFFGMFDKR